MSNNKESISKITKLLQKLKKSGSSEAIKRIEQFIFEKAPQLDEGLCSFLLEGSEKIQGLNKFCNMRNWFDNIKPESFEVMSLIYKLMRKGRN